MTPDLTPLSLDLLKSGKALDPALLLSARLHVGAAGIEQTSALERLIAAGQEHTGLVEAVRQVALLLRRTGTSAGQQRLLQESEHLLLVLDELATVVTEALQQITATPVQRISAQRLTDIADQMQRHLAALEGLIQAVEQSPDVPEAATPLLEGIQDDLNTEIRRIGSEHRQGQLHTLRGLIFQAISDLAALEQVQSPDRCQVLRDVIAECGRLNAALSTPSPH